MRCCLALGLMLGGCFGDAQVQAPEPEPDLPSSTAKLFLHQDEVRVTSFHQDQTAAHTVKLGAGVLHTRDAAALVGARGLFEVNLSTWRAPWDGCDVANDLLQVYSSPLGHLEVLELQAPPQPLQVGQAHQAPAQLVFVLGDAYQRVSTELEVTRIERGYALKTTVPVPLSATELGLFERLNDLAHSCSLGPTSDEVHVEGTLQVRIPFGQPPRMPVRPPVLVQRMYDEEEAP